MLDKAGWFAKLTADRPARAVVSPLSRCLQVCRGGRRGVRADAPAGMSLPTVFRGREEGGGRDRWVELLACRKGGGGAGMLS